MEYREAREFAEGSIPGLDDQRGRRVLLHWLHGNRLPKHPNQLRNCGDDFDCTYAYFEFSAPDQYTVVQGNVVGL
jgi:hypothetical protein